VALSTADFSGWDWADPSPEAWAGFSRAVTQGFVPEVSDRVTSAAAAFAAAQLDEGYQTERWGADPETARRGAAIKEDLDAAARFLALLRN
jgi:chaperone required for assembly of F1-ATPase